MRPLQQLTEAAEALGQDLKRPPLPEDGPREVQQAARAFNTMQQRLAAFIDERTRMLTALSHDLKTPLTRMRLRADLLDDDEQRLRFESDLKEMEAMVTQTLEFMRGLGGDEPRQPVDVMALLAALQADQQAMGRTVVLEGRAGRPCIGVASLLRARPGQPGRQRRALRRPRHGARGRDARHAAAAHPGRRPGHARGRTGAGLRALLRLEASRSRATGGTGLGLGIARNIARAHGGDVVLRNRARGRTRGPAEPAPAQPLRARARTRAATMA